MLQVLQDCWQYLLRVVIAIYLRQQTGVCKQACLHVLCAELGECLDATCPQNGSFYISWKHLKAVEGFNCCVGPFLHCILCANGEFHVDSVDQSIWVNSIDIIVIACDGIM